MNEKLPTGWVPVRGTTCSPKGDMLKSCGNRASFFSLKGLDNIAQGNAQGITMF